MRNFTFSLKWHTVLREYPVEIRREVFDAVIEYAATGHIIDMQPIARMAFDFIRYEIDEKARIREERAAKKSASSGITKQRKEKNVSKKKNALPDTFAEAPVPVDTGQPGSEIMTVESTENGDNAEVPEEPTLCENDDAVPASCDVTPVAPVMVKTKSHKVKMTVAQAIAAAGGKPRQIKVNGIRIKCPEARRILRRA